MAIWRLEDARSGIELVHDRVGETPVTWHESGSDSPIVVIAHGFAGSRQLMQALALSLAHGGYRVVSFDFQGHGRNPVPMSGDVTRIDGTTARLVTQTLQVIAAARSRWGHEAPMALLGHSMASDIVIRASLETRTDAIVAISMYSLAVTATQPDNLLIITGAFEPHLRRAALDALKLVSLEAEEGDIVTGQVTRSAIVAPYVEHVGVLYAPATLRAARDWIDASTGWDSGKVPVAAVGPWLLVLMIAIVALARPLAALLAVQADAPAEVPAPTFWLALFLPGLTAALASGLVPVQFLPVLIADALVIHLGLLGLGQLIILHLAGYRFPRPSFPGTALLVCLGIGVFGLALDRYGASFLPIPERLPIIAILAVGTLPCLLADAALTCAGRASIARRVAVRAAFFASLGLAVVIDPERLFFIALLFPVMLLFFLVHGAMGRWVGQRTGPTTSGLGLGLVLAWAIGVSFPLFAA